MKVISIEVPYYWDSIDSENDELDVFVDTEDGYSYVLSMATPKYIQSRMDYEKKNFYGPGYPLIVVNKLTPEIVEQAVQAFAEESEGYWLKIYHFGGWGDAITENIFDQLKAKHIKQLNERDE